jgi:hypothetical protein
MAKLTDSTYEIARPTGVCAASGRPIAPGDPYIAVLAERQDDEGLQRLDYSIESWERGDRPQPPLRMFGHWRATMQAGDPSRRAFIDDEALADLLEQLEGSEEPQRQSFRYVLALMLVRKRLYKFEGTELDAQGRQIMRLRRAEPAGSPPAEPLSVIDPGMDDAAIASAIEQLSAIMAGEEQ